MKSTELLRFFIFSCCIGPLLISAEEEGGGNEVKVPPCAFSHDELNTVLTELVEEGLTIYINCLSFDRKGSLVSGVVSGVDESMNPTNPGVRLVLTCVGDIIVGAPSSEAPLAQNMTSNACLNCVDQAADVCVDGKFNLCL